MQYRGFDKKMNPVITVSKAWFNKLLKMEVLRVSAAREWRLNLTGVRGLHGNHKLKKMYTNLKNEENETHTEPITLPDNLNLNDASFTTRHGLY
jgi:hypothetical protein